MRGVRRTVDSLVAVCADGPCGGVALDAVVVADRLEGRLLTVGGLGLCLSYFGVFILSRLRGHNGESVTLENTSLVMDPVADVGHLLGGGHGDGSLFGRVLFDHVLVLLIEAVDTLRHERGALTNASNLSAQEELLTLHEERVRHNLAFQITREANLD